MDEPNALIRWTMFHFASGEAFFVGLGLMLLAQAVVLRKRTHRALMWGGVLAAFGLVWIGLSSTSLSFSMWFLLASWLVLFAVSTRQSTAPRSSNFVPTPLIMAAFVAVGLLAAAGTELPHHVWSAPEIDHAMRLFVVADSVTAGLNENEETWPRMLADRAEIEVVDASQPGATLQSALSQAKLLGERPGIVLLEIGGNDVLENLPIERFEADMKMLLEAVAYRPRHTVVMFELPLPPGAGGYGRIQRELARWYNVTLIPKRKLIGLLTTRGATVDSIHLSPRGHAAMCDLVMQLFEFPAGSGSYVRLEQNALVR